MYIKPTQHCTSMACPFTQSHTGNWCRYPQPVRCGCAFCYEGKDMEHEGEDMEPVHKLKKTSHDCECCGMPTTLDDVCANCIEMGCGDD